MPIPKGFQFNGTTTGIKQSGASDLAVISTDLPGVAAGVYTQNVVRATSIDWNRAITPTENFRGIIINSGNANACTGEQGIRDNQSMAQELANQLSAQPEQVLVLSTGIIGEHLPMKKILAGIPSAVEHQGNSAEHFDRAAQAILTTDKSTKTVETETTIGGSIVTLAGMAKGAGMIGPNMATMLAIVLTDARLSPQTAQTVLTSAANKSFNRISVEGHTSTNDALMLICSGQGDAVIDSHNDIAQFESVLADTCVDLAKRIPADGEGATHLVTIHVEGAQSDANADQVARTVASSALVKTAITGGDPNWGRIVSSAGYAEVPMEIENTGLSINGHIVFQDGHPVDFDADAVSLDMKRKFETQIELTIGSGTGSATHWTSDLTVDYVRFNSEYHT